jgi:hypothetical protein
MARSMVSGLMPSAEPGASEVSLAGGRSAGGAPAGSASTAGAGRRSDGMNA